MELQTVTEIRGLRDSIREQIKLISRNDYTSTTYGGENEYTFKGVIGGLSALLTDISTLTKAPNKFIKLSTHAERRQIVTYLKKIDGYLMTPQNYITDFESIKILIRNYGVRNFSERQLEFESELSEVLKIKLQLEEQLIEVKKVQSQIKETESSIDESHGLSVGKLKLLEEEIEGVIAKKDKIVSDSELLEGKTAEVDDILVSSKEKLVEINESATESKSNEKLIQSFAARVEEREKKLSQIEQKTKDNTMELEVYSSERNSILQEAKELIDSAKQALNYKTAEGISASFQEQYDKASELKMSGWWIFGALVCLGTTIGLGVWVLDSTSTGLGIIIGRVSLLPFPIIGAIFCANQYTKQKNIIEDYAYKMVLSKAIVGFSEQLKENATGNNEEYVHYIKTALEEIHKDPLRKRENRISKKSENNSSNLNDLIEIAEKIVNMGKTNNG